MTVLQMRTVRLLDQKVPGLLRPLIRAYLLGYASTTVPRLLTLVLAYLTRERKKCVEGEGEQLQFWPSLRDTLRRGLDWQRLPTFCATLVGGSTLLQARDHFIGWIIIIIITSYSRSPYAGYLRVFLVAFQSLPRKGKIKAIQKFRVSSLPIFGTWQQSVSAVLDFVFLNL